HEAGCSVIEAVEKGELNRASYENYLKLEREKTWFETSARERKRTEKIFGRIIKDYSKKDVKGKKF
ncbi:MAG TPA: ribosome small subunit-dependent GTPase A, partial [Prolixibacteraceae bacterium]|nr:ribosome small subunit-dependent GTPase A [Prolixibacteraceae bacterium]